MFFGGIDNRLRSKLGCHRGIHCLKVVVGYRGRRKKARLKGSLVCTLTPESCWPVGSQQNQRDSSMRGFQHRGVKVRYRRAAGGDNGNWPARGHRVSKGGEGH